MNLSELFIRRPVMTVLVMAGILLFGLVGYRLLPVSSLPNIDFPTIQVSAELPGASPETMASAVATPLERQFTTIAGIDSMTSVSSQGITAITIQFSLDRDIDAAAQDVQSAIATALKLLPPTMTTPPSFRKVNPADFPVFYLALTSDAVPLYTVNEYAETYLAQRISTISGVAQVQVFGQQKYAVRVQLDPNALAARGIGINEVEQAVAQANVNLPTGTLYGKNRTVAVQATGQLFNADNVPAGDRHLPQRLAGPAERARAGDRQRAERQGRRVVQGPARHRARDPAPARHQHDRDRRSDPAACCPPFAPRCRPRSTSTSSTTARCRSGRPSTRCRSR